VQVLGRVATTVDVPILSHMLIGSVHLLFTDHESATPDAEALHKVVKNVIQGVVAAKGAERIHPGSAATGTPTTN
jgi:hypothetical protein